MLLFKLKGFFVKMKKVVRRTSWCESDHTPIWFSFYHCRGYNIGIRLIDEFLAKSNVSTCVDFRETAEVIAKVSVCFTIKIIYSWFHSHSWVFHLSFLIELSLALIAPIVFELICIELLSTLKWNIITYLLNVCLCRAPRLVRMQVSLLL